MFWEDGMIEHEELTKSKLRKIAEIIGKCYVCGIVCIPQSHRINRGYAGGKYTLKNIDFLCENDHKERHQNEIMGRKG
jgi:hypothetical protein